ncbi:ABC-type transport auxiliary lipoprotein family protein [Candidatus Uabimicrobium sp. HlEnr_7]|uniref:ABC-type transport auxiliary lipoprotein family protein n=1 Tax=Candidatus Uabimicrobium helgolandensis TaxID=3095367 RepID=UPI003558924A
MKKTILFTCTIVILLGSCSSPVTLEHYSLEFLEPSSSVKSSTDDSIGIEGFSSVKALERNEVVLRSKQTNQISFSSDNFWWALPKNMVDETFQNYLETQNIFRYVLHYPALQKIKYLIQGKVHRFEIEQSAEEWQAVIAVQIYLVDANTLQILWRSGIIESKTSSLTNMNDAAKSMEKNLVKLYRVLIKDLKNFLKVS